MKRRPVDIVAITFAVMFAAAAVGCSFLSREAEPVDKLAQAEALYTGTARTLLELRREGKIGDERWKVVKEVSDAADEGFEAIHAVLEADASANVDDMLAGVRASIDRLLTYKREAQADGQ